MINTPTDDMSYSSMGRDGMQFKKLKPNSGVDDWSTRKLFSKTVPLRITKAGCNIVEPTLVTASMKQPTAFRTPTASVLRVELTNEHDPCFLYIMEIDERQFGVLKTDQRLLVDFASFPNKFGELIDGCVPAVGYSETRFVACLSHEDSRQEKYGLLSFVETNQFRELTHLNLQLVRGTEEQVQAHIRQRLGDANSRTEALEAQLHSTERALKIAGEEVAKLNEEVAATRAEGENQQMAVNQATYALKNDVVVIGNVLGIESDVCVSDVKSLAEKIAECLKRMYPNDGSVKASIDRIISQGHTESVEDQFNDLQNKVALSIEEIKKGNAIISNLQTQLKNAKQKLKQKDSQLGGVEMEMDALRQRLALADAAGAQASAQASEIGSLKNKVQECENTIASNKKVIEYLNKQLTDKEIRILSGIGRSDEIRRKEEGRHDYRSSFVTPNRRPDIMPIRPPSPIPYGDGEFFDVPEGSLCSPLPSPRKNPPKPMHDFV